MEFLSSANTQKQLRAMTERWQEEMQILAQLIARGILEPKTNKTRGVLTDLVEGIRENVDILTGLRAAVLAQDEAKLEELMETHIIREA